MIHGKSLEDLRRQKRREEREKEEEQQRKCREFVEQYAGLLPPNPKDKRRESRLKEGRYGEDDSFYMDLNYAVLRTTQFDKPGPRNQGTKARLYWLQIPLALWRLFPTEVVHKILDYANVDNRVGQKQKWIVCPACEMIHHGPFVHCDHCWQNHQMGNGWTVFADCVCPNERPPSPHNLKNRKWI